MRAVCISTLNEAPTIGNLVRDLQNCVDRVIVVDNASTDATRAQAYRAGAIVIPNAEAIGIGPALMMAWQTALDSGAVRIAQMDAGGSHTVPDVVRALDRLDSADMVIGSRFMAVGLYYGGREWRKKASKLAAAALNRKTGANFTDWTSGLRAFDYPLIERLLNYPYRAKMHAWQIEVLNNARRLNANIAEIPIIYRAGRSSFGIMELAEALDVYGRL